ncbi:uncharacterized protein N7458_002606 [Penicillium daleae]|uniref:Azaphilone pigments biosynthesis cluster protein L N-terminal domain-containing protein n=1 Tax=Penicillium daleae TaxID=63821 RepID=A0AAD6CDB1_9EURO|nr:uncharacterized protein N7458_002606 [Penicillium daleae]KAJ5461054.1 hypothetical protein N7458_002606 [Penicillium daleae]
MAESVGLASGILALATFAFQSSVSLYETVNSFRSHPKRVRDLLGELEALSDVLAPLVDLIKSNYDADLSVLEMPLLRCGNVCKEFQQVLLRCVSRSNSNRTSFRDWARITYMGDDIKDFRDLLAGYKATINIALIDTTLRQSAVAVQSIRDYEGLIQDTKEDLAAQLGSIDRKLEQLAEKDGAQSESDVVELHSLREERLSTEKCLQICAQLSSHIDQIHLRSDDAGPFWESVGAGASPEMVTNEGLQECKNSLAVTAAKLEKHMRDIMDQLLSKSKTSISSDEDAQDLSRLRDEWETARQCLDICSRASSTERTELQMMEDEKYSTQRSLDICDHSCALIDQSQSRLAGEEEESSKPIDHMSSSIVQKSLSLATANSLDSVQKEDLSQGQLEEAEKVEVQVRETRWQIPGLEHPDAHFISEAAIHNTHVDFGDSDSSTDNNSVFSDPLSIPSTSSLNPGKEEITLLLIQQFANLLNEDGVVLLLLSTGVSKNFIGFQKMQNNFRRLLKQFANNLEADIVSEPHRDLKRFVSLYSVMITRELFAIAPIYEHRNIKPHVLEAEHGAGLVEKRQAREKKVELYLQSLHRGNTAPNTAPQASDVIKIFNTDDEESDQDSVAEEVGVVEPYEGSLQNLDQMKNFILGSTAYQILRRQLEEFVQPSLSSRFRDIVTRWSNPEHKNHGDIDRYKLRNLVTELQNASPFKIQFERNENSPRFVRFVSSFQHVIERWTGESWEWWPLPRCQRPLSESESRLRWKCIQP